MQDVGSAPNAPPASWLMLAATKLTLIASALCWRMCSISSDSIGRQLVQLLVDVIDGDRRVAPIVAAGNKRVLKSGRAGNSEPIRDISGALR